MNEIEKVGVNLPMVAADDLGYGEEISSEGMQLPIIKICQNATRERPDGCKPGDFYNATTGKVYGQKIIINVLKSFRGRMKFTPDYKLECKSTDGKVGSGLIGGTKDCATCPFSTWKTDEKERKTSYCPPVVTFLCMIKGDFIPGLLSMSKTREKAANKINSQLRYLIVENKALPAGSQVPVYFYNVELTTSQTEYNGNQIFDVDVKISGKEQDVQRQQILVGTFRDWKAFENSVRILESEAAEAPSKTKGEDIAF
jgi:hypothetical protein